MFYINSTSIKKEKFFKKLLHFKLHKNLRGMVVLIFSIIRKEQTEAYRV